MHLLNPIFVCCNSSGKFAILIRIDGELVIDFEPVTPLDVPVSTVGALQSYKPDAKAISSLYLVDIFDCCVTLWCKRWWSLLGMTVWWHIDFIKIKNSFYSRRTKREWFVFFVPSCESNPRQTIASAFFCSHFRHLMTAMHSTCSTLVCLIFGATVRNQQWVNNPILWRIRNGMTTLVHAVFTMCWITISLHCLN